MLYYFNDAVAAVALFHVSLFDVILFDVALIEFSFLFSPQKEFYYQLVRSVIIC